MRQSKPCGDAVLKARVAELEAELADAETIALGALDAAMANGEERDSEKARADAAEARLVELESIISRILTEEDPDGLCVHFDDARQALTGRKEG